MTKTLLTSDERAAINRLAREQLKQRLLHDILLDLSVCRLEGWNPHEYIDELISLLVSLREKSGNAAEHAESSDGSD